jgi:hypothetical protein
MAQRIVDYYYYYYYEHVDSDWIQFYTANQIIGILRLRQARGQCQAHLQHHSRHISHALHVYEVNHSIKSAPPSSINLKSEELFLASGQKSLSMTPDMYLYQDLQPTF